VSDLNQGLSASCALAFTPAAAPAQEQPVIEGDFASGSCHYAVTLTPGARTFKASISCSDLSATAAGSYQGSAVHLATLGFSAGQLSKTFKLDRNYKLSLSTEDPATQQQAWSELANRVTGDAGQVAQGLADLSKGVTGLPAGRRVEQAFNLMDQYQWHCADHPDDGLCTFKPAPQESSADDACPLPPPIRGWVRVCVPTLLAGSYKAPNVAVTPPFGLLIVLPIGPNLSSSTPVIRLTGAPGAAPGNLQITLGGVLGLNLDIEAVNVGVALGALALEHNLTLKASGELAIGRAKPPSAIWGTAVSAPAIVYAGAARLRAHN
jgi:hypothetical protein